MPDWISWPVLAAGTGFIAIIALFVWRWLTQSREPEAGHEPDLTIDISALPSAGPAGGFPRAEFYGVPVRIAVLVLAPVGREGRLPPDAELPAALEQLLPNLYQVIQRDRPIFRRWAPQLSREGFLRSFFHHMALPGDRGKNTPWCSIAGKFTADGTQYLAGMVCCADKGNGLSQVIVEHEGRWLDTLRVRTS